MIFWVLLLFAGGVLLIFAEFFVPGLVLSTIGAIMVLTSIGLGIYSYPDYMLFIIVGELLGVGLGVLLGFWVISRTRAGNLLTLRDAQTAESGYVSAESDASLLGQEGKVLTALRPSGTIMVGDNRVDAVADGVFIEEKKRVRVVQVHGSRVVVEELEDE